MQRILKVIVYILLSISLVVVIGLYLTRNHAQKLVIKRLEVVLAATFGNYYHIQSDSIHVDLTYQSLSIQIIHPVFTTDTLQKQFLQKFPVVFFKADTLAIRKINLRKLLLQKSLYLEGILLNNPQLSIFLNAATVEKTPTDSQAKVVKRNLIRNLEFHTLQIQRGNISLLPLNTPDDTLFYGDNINIRITEANFPNLSEEGLFRRATIGNTVITTNDVYFNPPRSPYYFAMDKLFINTKQNVVKCHKVNLTSKKSLYKRSVINTYQKTFGEVEIGSLLLKGVDYAKIAEHSLIAEYAELANTHFSLLRNKTKLLDKTAAKKSLQEALKSLNMTLDIDTVNLYNIHLGILVQFPKHQDPASIRIHHIKGKLLHLSNREHPKYPMELDIRAKIMQTGDLHFVASFPLHNERHSYKATISSMPFEEWNEVISKIADIKIESGNIKKIVLTGEATSMETKGNIQFEYRDLQATIYKRTKSGQLVKSPLLTLATNGLLRMRNPEKDDGIPVLKDFYFKREAYQGQIMLWVGGLIDGIEATLLNARLKKKVDTIEAKKVKERKR
jgi:hypothetical protein